MKRFIISLITLITTWNLPCDAQTTLFLEDFGNAGYFRGPANTYDGYSSNKSFFSDDSIAIHNWSGSTSDYEGASGEGFALCGYHDNDDVSLIIISGINTKGYTNVRLSFGAATWYGIASNYMDIYYSDDGSIWTLLDDEVLIEGEYASAGWGWVKLADTLPATDNLSLKFHVTNVEQTVRFDDIEITGLEPDDQDPSQPTGLASSNIGHSTFYLSWNASNDNKGISFYEVFLNGSYLTSTPDTVAEIKYVTPGSTAGYSVRAVDLSGNKSKVSPAIEVTLNTLPPDYRYSWQTQQAKVLPDGGLEWKPRSFSYEPGNSIRYIDFENGDDNNDGLSKLTPWKHHPWDASATANAKSQTGIHTYVFKRGVVYRGNLVAKESGITGNLIKLTSDPSWGSGEAAIYGSIQVTDGWAQADENSAPDIPEPEKVWYQDIQLPETKMICEVSGDQVTRLRVARSPNYQYTPDDPLKTWWKGTGKTYDSQDGKLWISDVHNMMGKDPGYFKGGTIWSQEDAIVMCSVWGQKILDYEPDRAKVSVNNKNFGGVGSHYYIENTPFLLDTANEFYYDKNAKRLYIRLEDNRDPNDADIEIATKAELIEIESKHHIEISGLSFGFTTANAVRYGYHDCLSTIRMTGNCSNIDVINNSFYFINGGVTAHNSSTKNQTGHDITVSDNDFYMVDDLSIVFAANNGIYFENVDIMRNNIYDNGARQLGRWYSSIPAIFGQLISGEVAGNIVDVSWGNGLDFFWGKSGSDSQHIPFVRGLIHHNKASNTLIGTNDYGGIESWQGGPAHVYNNVSHNASGYKHYNNSSIGYAYYFDGSFKHVVFNNIASGISHNRNQASIMQVLGFYNMYVHNTGYNTNTFFDAASRTLELNGHNTYLSNIGSNVNKFFRHQINPVYIPFESYGFNVCSQGMFKGNLEDKKTDLSFGSFKDRLDSYPAQQTHLGWETNFPVLDDPQAHDFSPAKMGEAIDKGVRFFTAFPLARVVGEWGFYKHATDSSIIMGDNFFMTSEFDERTTYKDVPKNHLKAYGLSDTSFRTGVLENWIKGALFFDGLSTYCAVKHSETVPIVCNNVDMTDNNFILDVFFKADSIQSSGTLISKYDGVNGYTLDIDDDGRLRMQLFVSGVAAISAMSDIKVNDELWHHAIVEVNREGTINIYLDGEVSDGGITGTMPEITVSLSNTADLWIGKDMEDNYFKGTMDFLRISKGLLRDAKTTIHELYTWQTDGPFLYDFSGKSPIGQRDAGAIEAGEDTCRLSVGPTTLEAENAGLSAEITVNPANGYEIYKNVGDFFSTDIADNIISLTVYENEMAGTRNGEIWIRGCGEAAIAYIDQEAAPCEFNIDMDTITFSSQPDTFIFKLNTNAEYSLSRDTWFFNYSTDRESDSVMVWVQENTATESRTGALTINGCAGGYYIMVEQAGKLVSTGHVRKQDIQLFPNPAENGEVKLFIPSIKGRYIMKVTDLSGKLLYEQLLVEKNQIIDLPVPSGIYQISITGSDKTYRARLMVQ